MHHVARVAAAGAVDAAHGRHGDRLRAAHRARIWCGWSARSRPTCRAASVPTAWAGASARCRPRRTRSKLLAKEDIIPTCADKWVFILAPFLVFVPALLVFLVVPFSKTLDRAGPEPGRAVRDRRSPPCPVIGLLMAGWGSNNKYALLGAMRAAAQADELRDPAGARHGLRGGGGRLACRWGTSSDSQLHDHWFILRRPLMLAFLIYFIAALAEVNRVPFDLPEAESELVAGYFTEYSGMRFAFFFLAEFAHLFFVPAFAVALFFGGWEGPWLPGVAVVPDQDLCRSSSSSCGFAGPCRGCALTR